VCRDLAGPRGGFDVAFEVSGVRGVLPPLLNALRREATLITIGHPSEPTAIDIAAYVNKKGITLRGIFGRRLWDTWEQLLSCCSPVASTSTGWSPTASPSTRPRQQSNCSPATRERCCSSRTSARPEVDPTARHHRRRRHRPSAVTPLP
jgi:hypothetical protein